MSRDIPENVLISITDLSINVLFFQKCVDRYIFLLNINMGMATTDCYAKSHCNQTAVSKVIDCFVKNSVQNHFIWNFQTLKKLVDRISIFYLKCCTRLQLIIINNCMRVPRRLNGYGEICGNILQFWRSENEFLDFCVLSRVYYTYRTDIECSRFSFVEVKTMF